MSEYFIDETTGVLLERRIVTDEDGTVRVEIVGPGGVVEPAPSEAEDTAAMLVDHEYRLTLLELGVAEEV